MNKWAGSTAKRAVLTAALGLILLGLAQVVMGGNVDPVYKWAWATNAGWINFDPLCDGCEGVTVFGDHLEGYAWGENIGWIRLGTHTGGGSHSYHNTTATNYGVNIDRAVDPYELYGYAWGTNVGWILFDPIDGGVTIDPNTGSFEGYAWAENVGWIHFKNSDPPYNVVATNDPPIADDDSASTPENTLVAIDVAANDSDPEGSLEPATANSACAYGSTGCAGATHGSLTDNGDGTITYTPDLDYNGPDSFVYEICDSGTPSLCDTASVAITVMPVSNRLYLPLLLRIYAEATITNGGFETGDFTGWIDGGEGPSPLPRSVQDDVRHEGGTYAALLGEAKDSPYLTQRGSAWMVQEVAVPSGPHTLSFWYRLITYDKDETGFFKMELRDTGGAVLKSLVKLGWTGIISPSWGEDFGWRQRTFDLSPYQGQTIQLWFETKQAGLGQGTWTYVDDVRVD